MRRILALAGLAATIGCGDKQEVDHQSIKSISWLEGRWASEDTSGGFIEHWMIHGDKMHGQGAMVRGTDTMMSEKLTIVQDSTGLKYVVKFPEREITFASTKRMSSQAYKSFKYSEVEEITFTNDTNDFPREIIYRRQDDDSLYITLRGSAAGRPMEQVLRMKRL
jgi:hypothetical protein